jgi:hypothetical protein
MQDVEKALETLIKASGLYVIVDELRKVRWLWVRYLDVDELRKFQRLHICDLSHFRVILNVLFDFALDFHGIHAVLAMSCSDFMEYWSTFADGAEDLRTLAAHISIMPLGLTSSIGVLLNAHSHHLEAVIGGGREKC